MKNFTKFIFLSLLMAFSFGLSAQTTYYVGESGSDDNDGLSQETAFATLYKAVAKDFGVADSGDVVIVIGNVLNAPDSLDIDGTMEYFENGYPVNKILTIEGMGSDAVVEVKGRSIWSGVTCYGGDFVVKNLTFTNTLPDVEISKSVMKLQTTYAPANIFLENCTFKNLPGKASGGVIYIFGHNVTIDGCTFMNCSGNQGGVMYIDGNLDVGGSGDFELNYKTTVNISSSAFINNKSKHHGGAIVATTGYQVVRNQYSPIDLNITNTTFYGNSSERDPSKGGGNGGAIFITGENPIKGVTTSEELSNVKLTNVTIVGNKNRKSASFSGGIKYSNSRPGRYEANNCLFYGNVAMQEDAETGETNPVNSDFDGGTKVDTSEVTEHMEVIMKNSLVGIAIAGYNEDLGTAKIPNITSVDSEFGVFNKVDGITSSIDTIEFVLDKVTTKGIVMFNDEQLPYDFGLVSNLGSITVDQIGNVRGTQPFGATSVGAWEFNENDLINTGIENVTTEKNQNFVYPNPITESARINVPGGKNAEASIYSITGAKVWSGKIQGSYAFPVNQIKRGIYIVKLSSDKNIYIQKVILK